MNGAFHISGIGLSNQQSALDVIANNIANLNTRSFKRSDVRFSEIIAMQSAADIPAANLTIEPGVAGVMTSVQFMLNDQGVIERTDNPLDLAVDGEGFIELMGPRGDILLWRGGSLAIGEDGMLTADNGLPLKALINIPIEARALQITPEGQVSAIMGGEEPPVELGQISLVRTHDGADLDRLDGGLYRLTETTDIIDAMPGEDGSGFLVQGAVERSNVDLNKEMIEMMVVQRAYAANAQVVQAADQMMSIANNLRR